MSRYSINYQQLHDIDWFFQSGGKYYHVASNGGEVPSFVERKNNMELQNIIEKIDALIPENEITVIEHEDGINYESFIRYARKGFISIDKIRDAFNAQNYQEIARPIGQTELPDKIRELIPKTNNHTIKITPIHGEEYSV